MADTVTDTTTPDFTGVDPNTITQIDPSVSIPTTPDMNSSTVWDSGQPSGTIVDIGGVQVMDLGGGYFAPVGADGNPDFTQIYDSKGNQYNGITGQWTTAAGLTGNTTPSVTIGSGGTPATGNASFWSQIGQALGKGGLAGAIAAVGNIAGAAYSSSAQQGAANLLANTSLQSGKDLATAASTATGQKIAGLQGGLESTQNTLASILGVQAPYQAAGGQALNTLNAGLASGGQFNRAFSMEDMKNVMPAYTFARDQGLAAMDNQMARGGQNLSSNAIQGAGTLASGLASQYEQQAFNQWLSQNNLTLGALQNMVKTGQVSTQDVQRALSDAGVSSTNILGQIGATAAAGTLGAATALSSGDIGAANALAAGKIGSANTMASGLSNAANQFAGLDAYGKALAGNPTQQTTTPQPNQSIVVAQDPLAVSTNTTP